MRKKEYLDMQTTETVSENIEFIEKKFQNTSREISEKNKSKIKQILKKDGKKTK